MNFYRYVILSIVFLSSASAPLYAQKNHTEHKNTALPVNQVQLIIFSYNRPLQLYAMLESIEKYMTGLKSTTIIYRADNDDYQAGYQEIKDRFNEFTYIRQGDNPKTDFKLHTVNESFYTNDSPYIMYGVDDIVVKDYVNATECAHLLETYDAYAFYLRLGKNLTDCYSLDQPQPLPPLTEVKDSIFSWKFNEGVGDWAYPHSVDMTIIRKKDIQTLFERMTYHAPNTLEAAWAQHATPYMHKKGLCCTLSVIVNFPLNLVQTDWNNRHMTEYTAAELLRIFQHNKKIDIAPLHQMHNPGAHTEYSPTFIQRKY